MADKLTTIKFTCPRCGSAYVQTTKRDRYCRRCGYRGKPGEFESQKKDTKR